MAKLTTEQKIEKVGSTIIASLESGETNIETLCGVAFIGKAIEDGSIKFGELPALCKTFAIEKGFIKTLEQRRDDYRAFCKAYELSTITAWLELESFVTEHSEAFDLPEKWCLDTVSQIMTNLELYVPKKSTLTPWQVATVKAFRANNNLSKQELETVISEHVQNFEHYAHLVHGLCHTLMNAEITVD